MVDIPTITLLKSNAGVVFPVHHRFKYKPPFITSNNSSVKKAWISDNLYRFLNVKTGNGRLRDSLALNIIHGSHIYYNRERNGINLEQDIIRKYDSQCARSFLLDVYKYFVLGMKPSFCCYI